MTRPVPEWRKRHRRALAKERRCDKDLQYFANTLREVFGQSPLYVIRKTPRPPAPELVAAAVALVSAGATQRQVARELDISQGHVSKLLSRATEAA